MARPRGAKKEPAREVHEVYRGGLLHVLAEKCSSCIFRPVKDGRIMGLAPGRVGNMVIDARANQSVIPCHNTIRRDDVQPAICRGYYDLPHQPVAIEVARAMEIVTFDPPPEDQ